MISVITVSNRYGGVDTNWSSIRRQSHENFEWIFCDTLYEKRKEALQNYTRNDKRVVHIKQTPKDSKARTWLAHAENQAVKHAKGELLVFVQDYIHFKPDTLEKFWNHYQADKKRMVTGVGHQYGLPGKDQVVNREGLITVFKEPFEREPQIIVWQDPRIREDQGTFYKCMPADWEVNFASVPKQALLDIGGFDEEYDYVGFAFDNVSVAMRAFSLGYEPYIDQSIKSYSIRHEDFFEHKEKKDYFQDIAQFHIKRMNDIKDGLYPLKFKFLDNNG